MVESKADSIIEELQMLGVGVFFGSYTIVQLESYKSAKVAAPKSVSVSEAGGKDEAHTHTHTRTHTHTHTRTHTHTHTHTQEAGELVDLGLMHQQVYIKHY
jgi:ABC-type nickel/cobalt efflux system permease component RcnA